MELNFVTAIENPVNLLIQNYEYHACTTFFKQLRVKGK